MTLPKPLIETDELQQLLNQSTPNLKIFDATYHVPPSPRQAFQEYQDKHLPGALFFDIDAISDTTSNLPHMLPSPEQFAAHMQRLGISNQDKIVVYDMHGVMSAARAWWMFRVFGHDDVTVLNGGLPKWEAEGNPLENTVVTPTLSDFKVTFNPVLVLNWQQVQQNIEQSHFQLLDARSAGRFSGQDAEPRAGLRQGHIPGSYNLAWNALIDPERKTFLPVETLEERFQQAGLDFQKPFACTCGSGVTACIDALGLFLLGQENVPVYDGSWAEWGSRDDLPVAQAQPV